MDYITTLSYKGRRGVVLSTKDYDAMQDFILSSFGSQTQISFAFLMDNTVHFKFQQKETTMWQLIKVKEDLQARGVIKIKFVGTSPRIQVLVLNKRVLKMFKR